MGLFDKVVKQGLEDALGGALGSKVTNAIEQATGVDLNASNMRPDTQTAPVPQAQDGSAAGWSGNQGLQAAPVAQRGGQVTDKAYFRSIITDCFGNYIMREDVPVTELGGEGKPNDFALFANGDCAGVIMLVDHNRDNNRAYKGAKAAAQASGVPFINFYTQMTNERGFVINRIKRLAKPAG